MTLINRIDEMRTLKNRAQFSGCQGKNHTSNRRRVHVAVKERFGKDLCG